MKVRAEIALFRLALNGRHHFIADHEAANIAPFRLFDVLLHQDVRIETPKGINHALRRLTRFSQHHANALRAFHQLDDQRRAAHHVDKIAGVVR